MSRPAANFHGLPNNLPVPEDDGSATGRSPSRASSPPASTSLYPVFPPQDNAADVIAWIRTSAPEEGSPR